jgi:hypothetical protein
MALLRRGEPVRLETVAARVKRAVLAGALLALFLAADSGGVVADTWRANYRIGPVLFNHPLGDDVQVLERGTGGRFAARPRGGGPIVRGILFEDPNSGDKGARAIWTRSREISFHDVRVGVHWRTAKRRLPGRWTLKRFERCGWLNSSRLRRDRTGPVSTQLFFRRSTGRIYEIALNEITEIGCPGQ